VDGTLKVTGNMPYAADFMLDGCLHVAAVRADYAHARILSIDTAAALAIPGVRSVITGGDVANVRTGRGMRDVPILAVEKCRFRGEMIAAVAAEDKNTAERAARLVQVVYDPLPAVFDPQEALQPGSVVLHEQPWTYALAERDSSDHPNVVARNTFKHGPNIEDAFARSQLVFEHTFRTQKVHQGYLEPNCCIAVYEPSGVVQVWSNNKSPHPLREQLSRTFDLPAENIRIHVLAIGGDFGGKGTPMDIPVCLELARRTGRPVRMLRSYTEELVAGDPPPDTVTVIRIGVSRTGIIQAYHLRSYINAGAYGGFTPFARALVVGASSYRLPASDIETIRVYTNQVPSGQMRAPGCSQMTFAVEGMMDYVATELGIDPVEFRRRNLLTTGETTHAGQCWPEQRGLQTLELACATSSGQPEQPEPTNVRYGRGVALYDRPTHSAAKTSVRLRVIPNGHVDVELAIPETGTGSHTVMHGVLADLLQLPRARVGLRPVSTEELPFAVAVGGQRVGVSQIEMAVVGAETLKRAIVERAAEYWGVQADAVAYSDGSVRRADGYTLRVEDLVDRVGVIETSAHIEEGATRQAVTNYCAQIAQVGVDLETGQVHIRELVTAHDVANILEPGPHEGQIEGGVIMGMGFALMEDLAVVDGQVSTLHLGDYKLPTTGDTPPLRIALLSDGIGVGARNVKSIGEMSNVPTAAAIANAVSDALGVRLDTLPLSAEKVLQAVKRSPWLRAQ
jgi:CO/xanthine dehydrogenase Mo-binding subunit